MSTPDPQTPPAAYEPEWVEFPCGHRFQGVFGPPPETCLICDPDEGWIYGEDIILNEQPLWIKKTLDADALADRTYDRETIDGG